MPAADNTKEKKFVSYIGKWEGGGPFEEKRRGKGQLKKKGVASFPTEKTIAQPKRRGSKSEKGEKDRKENKGFLESGQIRIFFKTETKIEKSSRFRKTKKKARGGHHGKTYLPLKKTKPVFCDRGGRTLAQRGFHSEKKDKGGCLGQGFPQKNATRKAKPDSQKAPGGGTGPTPPVQKQTPGGLSNTIWENRITNQGGEGGSGVFGGGLPSINKQGK